MPGLLRAQIYGGAKFRAKEAMKLRSFKSVLAWQIALVQLVRHEVNLSNHA